MASATGRKEVVTIRVDPEDRRLLERFASDRGLKMSQLAREWVRSHIQRELLFRESGEPLYY